MCIRDRYIMTKEEKEIEKLLKCKKCNKLDPILSFIIDEHLEFLKFIKKKDTPKMECHYCNGTMIPI